VTLSNPVTITGSTTVLGMLAKGSGTFVIDDPLDPLNKLLYHSFVESPDAMNVYDGVAVLNNIGEATVELPPYFLALNEDFTYLASPIGAPMPNLHISAEVQRRFLGLFGAPVFKISGGMWRGKVAWQVAGVRHDPYILAHPIIPEVEKGNGAILEKGQYQCPECYGR
jgi:hypothetical protein